MHLPIPVQGKWLRQVVNGFFNSHAVPTNRRGLCAFRFFVTDLWRQTLNPAFARRAEIIASVPGLGDQAVAGLIAWAPELGRIRNEAAAALIGAARLRRRQRRMQRPAIKGGRRKLRNLLYMPVMGAATQHNPVIKAYYQRLRSPRASKPRSLSSPACAS
jgi:hypothetical protein